MLFGLYSETPNPFEKDINDALLLWLVKNERMRTGTSLHYRVFSFFAKDTLQVNMNSFFDEYQQKFVIPNQDKYMAALIKKIEPVIFEVMVKWGMSDYNLRIDFHIKSKTYTNKVRYSLTSKVL